MPDQKTAPNPIPFKETEEFQQLNRERVLAINAAWVAFCFMRDSLEIGNPAIIQSLSRGYDAKQAQIEAQFSDDMWALFQQYHEGKTK